MLDDRAESVANKQYVTGQLWSVEMNSAAWGFTIPTEGNDDVSEHLCNTSSRNGSFWSAKDVHQGGISRATPRRGRRISNETVATRE